MTELLPILNSRYRSSRLVQRIGGIGTSSFEYFYEAVSGPPVQINTRSDKNFFGWLAVLCPQVRIDREAIQGFGAQTSNAMLSTGLPALLALDYVPALTFVQVPQNDFPDLTFEQSTTNILQIVEALLARGGHVCLITQHPRGSTQTDANARAFALRQNRFAEWMQRNVPGVLWANVAGAVTDRTVAGQYAYKSGYLTDNIHLNDYGAFITARDVFKPIVDKIFPSSYSGIALSDQDIYSASNPYGAVNGNPTMLGTGGTVGSNVAAGPIATGYTAYSTITGVTITPSKLTEGDRVWQRFLFAGTPTAQGFFQFDALAANIAPGALAAMPGYDYELEVEYRIVPGTGGSVLGAGPMRARFTRSEGGTTIIHRTQAIVDTSFVSVPFAHNGVLRTQVASIAGTVANITDTKLYYQNSATFAAHDFYLDIGAFSLHRVPKLSDIAA